METRTRLIGSTVALLLLAGAFAAFGGPGRDATSVAIAALRANLGNAVGLEIDEVRVTDTGVACIDYRVREASGNSPAHAVVHGDEVIKSSTDDKRFEERWTEHCLGPRGGA